jgi:hypothetical protein
MQIRHITLAMADPHGGRRLRAPGGPGQRVMRGIFGFKNIKQSYERDARASTFGCFREGTDVGQTSRAAHGDAALDRKAGFGDHRNS